MTLEFDLRNERENKRQETLRLLVQLLTVRSTAVSRSKVRVKLIAHEVSFDREPVVEHFDATKLFVPVYDTHRTENHIATLPIDNNCVLVQYMDGCSNANGVGSMVQNEQRHFGSNKKHATQYFTRRWLLLSCM